MSKLKIALLSYRSAPFGGGQGVYVHDISKALAMKGHQVDIISGPPYPKISENVNLIELPGLDLFQTFSFKERVRIFWEKKSKTRFDYFEFCSVLFGGFPEMLTFGYRAKDYLINNSDYDIVIDNQSISYGMLEIQKLLPLIEIIHHPITKDYEHDLQANNKLLYRFSRYRWYSFLKMQKKVAPHIKNIITPSLNSLKDISRDFKCNSNSMNVIHNGLDVDIFIPYSNIKRDQLRLITTASADVPLKGLDYTLEALSFLKKEFCDINLVVIGKLKQEGHTSRLIKRLGLENIIQFKTNLTKKEIAEEYACSSIAIVSSLYEGFGYPVIEAMSCSVPLIAANTSSIPELVGDYATLIPSRDSTSLAKSIKLVISDYEKYKNIAEKGRLHVLDNFSWTKITEEYESVIYKIIEDYKNANL
ncbi:glycosyltransferase family 4 protein [Gammaproteobacteria bacterium]|nr:glycosyltransferase family 4 protein [Gammaproteobacteria bacterium]MDA8908412.1 glycosyltransferase family 4 protein [Gammaproteobacteria bacterium]MDA9113631.1 glycosyltransferase family 4 protein [Gammaproteobacteria bacterium]MDB4156965.1 glycosyltransferase family 4 protein [Gammaproteobacteria bacterium]MDB4835688.1 glycosyltransferase family 4 protein [Gammaproteobacteria bacterium]